MAMVSGQSHRCHDTAILCAFSTDRKAAQDASSLFSWLEPEFNPRSTAPGLMHIEKSDLQEANTCTWMTDSTLWRDWLQGGSASVGGCRRFMWIHGLPGTGKTILASFLIDKLLDKVSLGCSGPGKAAKGSPITTVTMHTTETRHCLFFDGLSETCACSWFRQCRHLTWAATRVNDRIVRSRSSYNRCGSANNYQSTVSWIVCRRWSVGFALITTDGSTSSSMLSTKAKRLETDCSASLPSSERIHASRTYHFW